MSRRPLPVVAAGVVLLLSALSGCAGSAVAVDPVRVPPAQTAACRALVQALPAKLGGQVSRPVRGNALSAAWGDPAIVVRCGVGPAKGFTRASVCQQVNGVGWYVPEQQIADQGADVLLTTIGRTPRVELAVPAQWRPPDGELVDLAGVVKAHTVLKQPCQ